MAKNTKIRNGNFFVIAHNIRSLYNVGSIFRSADAFLVFKIYLTGYTGTPENLLHREKIGKVALGAENWLIWEHRPSAVRLIKELRLKYPNITIVALENHIPSSPPLNLRGGRARALQKFKPKFPMALVLGEEVKGINKSILAMCDEAVEIPMLGKKESLNVAVAFGIAAYHVSRFL